jgi:hypothetical protein
MTNSRKSVKLEVSGEIVCKVQAVLDDLILVSYQANNNKVFQGVLLDSTRRYRFMKKMMFWKFSSRDSPKRMDVRL